MDFGEVLDLLKQGSRVWRAGWNGKGMWIELVDAGAWSVNDGRMAADYERLPWIGMKTATGEFVPWLASQTDLLADDWESI